MSKVLCVNDAVFRVVEGGYRLEVCELEGDGVESVWLLLSRDEAVKLWTEMLRVLGDDVAEKRVAA